MDLRPAVGSDSDQAAAGEEAVVAVVDRLEEALLAHQGSRVHLTRVLGGAPTGVLDQEVIQSRSLLRERPTSLAG